MSARIRNLVLCLAAIFVLSLTGCLFRSEDDVTVFAALDKEFSEPILDEYEDEQELSILAKFDTESQKTVGLVSDIIEHAEHPRCDVFWNNEILHTLRLQKMGMLEPFETKLSENYPESFTASDHTWHGFAARARVLIVNTEKLPDPNEWPKSVNDLADPKWKGNCGIARPLFGTTASHAAVLFSQWGTEKATTFFDQVSRNAVVEGGNKQVAQRVAEGDYAWGITDTDDAIIEKDAGRPVAIVFPDQSEDQPGCLQIPNTLAIIKGGPNTKGAKKLVEYLLSTSVEEKLAQGDSAQIPLNKKVEIKSRAVEGDVRWMVVDFEKAAEVWDASREILKKQFPIGGRKD